MIGSAIVYLGLIGAAAGLVLIVKPIRRFGVTTRWRGLGVAGAGVLLAGIGLILPAPETRVARIDSRLDEVMPVFQFHEVHSIHIAAPPARVYEVSSRVRPDEIFLFRTLIAIRSLGQPPPGAFRMRSASTSRSTISPYTAPSFLSWTTLRARPWTARWSGGRLARASC